jgi:hypothetical protein
MINKREIEKIFDKLDVDKIKITTGRRERSDYIIAPVAPVEINSASVGMKLHHQFIGGILTDYQIESFISSIENNDSFFYPEYELIDSKLFCSYYKKV